MAALAAEVGGVVPDDPGLLDEVTDLVEQPTAIRGSFEAEYLRLPKEVLITVMKKHQRYFPVVEIGSSETGRLDAATSLLPTSSPCATAARTREVVQAGNEGVIRARYADAAYFFKADTARKLADFTPRLATLTFQEKLGSMLDKVHRLEQLAPAVGQMLGLDDGDLATTARARPLSQERPGDADGGRADLAAGDHGPRVRPPFR